VHSGFKWKVQVYDAALASFSKYWVFIYYCSFELNWIIPFSYSTFELMNYLSYSFISFCIQYLFIREELLVIVLLLMHIMLLFYFHSVIELIDLLFELSTLYKSLCFNSFHRLLIPFSFKVHSFVLHFDYLIWHFIILSFISICSIYHLFFYFEMI